MILRLALLALMLAGSAGAQPVPEPDGFRGETLSRAGARNAARRRGDRCRAGVALHKQGVPFIDAMPRQKRPEGLPAGTILERETPSHHSRRGLAFRYRL